jgi:K+-sensing histidine kinase KdpD
VTGLGGWDREAGVHLGLDVPAAFVASAVFFLVAAAIPIAGHVVFILLLGAAYLYVVMLAARRLGPLFAVPLAIAGANAFDPFYIPPIREFGADNWQNWLVVAIYIAVGILIGLLGEYSRRHAEVSEARRSELAREQAALRQVATLVARQASPDEVFAKMTEEVGRLLGAECAAMVRYPDADTGRIVAAWGPVPIQRGQEFSLEHDGVSARCARPSALPGSTTTPLPCRRPSRSCTTQASGRRSVRRSSSPEKCGER